MKHKIGLVLGGGGGKGAFQVGVWKALCEYKLDKKISCMSGSSIGALNSVLFSQKNGEESYEIWSNLDMSIALSTRSIKDVISKKGLFSREGLKRLLHESLDLSLVSKCKRDLYVCATNIDDQVPTYFHINDEHVDTIESILLASSAIPVVFDRVSINDKRYMDGYKYANVPTKPLLDLGCHTLFVIDLNGTYVPNESELEYGARIISISSPYNSFGFAGGTLSFNQDTIQLRIEHGYHVAKQMIEHLRNEGVIAITLKEKIKKFFNRKKEFANFYYLKKEDIEHRINVKKK